eukprot:gene4797-5424_t
MLRKLFQLKPVGESEQMFFYAVRTGRQTGIFKSWSECEEQVKGFKGARFKKFKTRDEALSFVAQYEKARKSKVPQHVTSLGCNAAASNSSSGIPVVYTDGGCFKNGSKINARAGIGVFWGAGDNRNVSERLAGHQTNQRAELNAVIKALETAVKRGATTWIKKWKKNGWKTVDREPVKNMEDIRKLDDLCSKINVKWAHVRGHQGIFGNEEADRLSKMGADSEPSTEPIVSNYFPTTPPQTITDFTTKSNPSSRSIVPNPQIVPIKPNMFIDLTPVKPNCPKASNVIMID